MRFNAFVESVHTGFRLIVFFLGGAMPDEIRCLLIIAQLETHGIHRSQEMICVEYDVVFQHVIHLEHLLGGFFGEEAFVFENESTPHEADINIYASKMGCLCSSEPVVEHSSIQKRDALVARGKSISTYTDMKADYYQTTINIKMRHDTSMWQLMLFHKDPEFKNLSLKMLKEEIVASSLWYYDDRYKRVLVKDQNPQHVSILAANLDIHLHETLYRVTTSFDLKSFVGRQSLTCYFRIYVFDSPIYDDGVYARPIPGTPLPSNLLIRDWKHEHVLWWLDQRCGDVNGEYLAHRLQRDDTKVDGLVFTQVSESTLIGWGLNRASDRILIIARLAEQIRRTV